MKILGTKTFRAVVAAIGLGFCCVSLSAQRNTASIVGTVADPAGGIVASASVQLVSDETAQAYKTVSDGAGRFVLLEIPPGVYTLKVSEQGFKQYMQRNIVLNVGDRPALPVALEVGAISESVSVEAENAVIEPTQASIGAFIDNVNTHQLPLNGRQFLQLTLVLPGVSTAAGGQTTARGGGPRNIGVQGGGNRATNNTFVIDGVDSFGFRFKNTSLQPSVASVAEFKVLESPYDPQYGVVSGLTVNVITKSGTNEIHGEVFEFFRNDALDARNYFDDKKPPYHQNQYGGTAGFPIIKNKTFFFGSYEGLRVNQGLSSTSIVPTAQEAAGDFSQSLTPVIDPTTGEPFPGNGISSDRISPIASHFLTFFPAPNANGQGYNYLNAAPDTIKEYQVMSRIDHTLSSKWRVFGRYSIDDVNRFDPGSIPQFGTYGLMTVQDIALGATYLIGPNTIFDLHIGYNRENAVNRSQQVGKQTVASFGIKGLSLSNDPSIDGVPNVGILGCCGVGDTTYSPEGRVENSEQIIPNFLHTIGRHTLRVGATIWPVQLNRVSVSGTQRGAFSFTNLYTQAATGLPDFELGLVQQATLDTGRGHEDARTILQSDYVGDDFRVSPRLTLNAGLRYELAPAFVDKGNRLSTFIPEGAGRIVIANDPSNGFSGRKNRALYSAPLTRFLPRLEFAYDLGGKGKTVLRGGYGMFGNIAIFNSQFLSALNPPFVVTRTYQADPSANVNLPFADPFSINPLAGGLPGGLEVTSTFEQAYMQQWSLGVQRALASSLGLDIEYVANKGTHLDGLRYINQGALNGATNVAYYRPFQNFGTFLAADSFAYSNYNSLQVKLTRRFENGLTFIAGYTYSHSLDNSSGEGGGSGGQFITMDTTRPSVDYGSSDFDVRHRFTLSGVWDLPIGKGKALLGDHAGVLTALVSDWRVSWLWQAQTGFPFTIGQSGNQSGTFGGGERAQLLCPSSQAQGQRQRTSWFDKSCFGLSPLGTFGNSGRNMMRYAGQDNVDFSLVRSFPFAEKRYVEFRGELFNALNHTQFGLTGGVGTNVSAPASFGVYTAAQPSRVAQLALRIDY